MKKTVYTLLLLMAATGLQATDVKTRKGTVCVTFMQPDIVRIAKTTDGRQPTQGSLVVTMQPQPCRVSTGSANGVTTLVSKALAVAIDNETGRVTFSTRDGRRLLSEGDWSLTPVTNSVDPMLDQGCVRAKASFLLDKDEPIYGIGLMENHKMNQRGEHRRMMQSNLEDFQNVMQSLKGYAIFWDNYSPTQLDDTPDEGLTLDSEVADGIDYYFMYGQTADGNLALIRQLTGDVPMLPLWSYGFWQSRERYKSQAELQEVVDNYRRLGVPLDGIILDWQYWDSNYLWNAMEFLNPEFSNAKGMIDYVHSKDVRFAISIWQSFGPHTKPYRDLDERGLLFDFETWPQSGISKWPPRMDYPSGVRVYKPYSAEARDIYWQHLRRLYDLGVDMWWMDSTDPDHHSFKESDLDQAALNGGEPRAGDAVTAASTGKAVGATSFRKLRNAFPLECVRGVYEHQRQAAAEQGADDGETATATGRETGGTAASPLPSANSPRHGKRVMILTRSGFAGQQRYASNVWTGDVRSDWPTLRNQLPMLLNYSLTGNPHTNTDIGGFFSGSYNRTYRDHASGARNPQFQELYVRWMQFGAFCPMMRSHGTETYRELYYYGHEGQPVYDALVAAIKLRYRLLPYIYSTAWQVTKHRDTFMRALWMDYPADPRTHDMKDEFLFGRSLLVAPIVEAQYTPEKRMKFDEMSGWDKKDGAADATATGAVDFTQQKTTTVYLPEGRWYDCFSGQAYDGAQEVTLPTTLQTIPLFARAGSIVPIGGDIQSTAQRDWTELELRVYPGADGRFTLYEDDGETYAYEQGQYTEIQMTWNDRRRTLTIGKRQGRYPGMMHGRTFVITLPDGTQKTVGYDGRAVSVSL